MEWLLGACAGLLTYTYLGYPVLAAALARLWPRPIWLAPIEPSVSLVIVARNEERELAGKLESALALDYPREKVEIVVASDGSTDRTEAIAEGFAARGVALLRAADHPGRTETANRAVEQTRGEILVFSDATGQYERGALRALVRNFADPEVGAVSGRVVYRYARSAAAQGFRAFEWLNLFTRSAENAWGSETSVNGSICAVRRENFTRLPAHLDFELAHPLHVALGGRRTVYESEAVANELARADTASEFEARVRMAAQAYGFLPYLLARLMRCRSPSYLFQILSHKLARWLAPFGLVGLLYASSALAAEHGLAAALLALQLGFYTASALALVLPHAATERAPLLLGVPLFFITLQLGSLVGFGRWLAASASARAASRR
jgi:cellulose synthase/poly-beta-1,6-N-acetylglucosamine synthase-like glycosyltransferase